MPAAGVRSVDDDDAVELLKTYGLSTYEAAVFVALQKLGVGTARDVARVSDVHRSQVYGAAEALEERGLLEVHQGNPMQFRPVDLAEAEARLGRRLERDRERAFEYLEAVQGSEGEARSEEQEAIWTIHGRGPVDDRVRELIAGADREVVYGADAGFLDAGVEEVLLARLDEGVAVTVVSADEAVLEVFEGTGVETVPLPVDLQSDDWPGGRMLVADGDTVLLSVLGQGEGGDVQETAFWSAETAFARVLVRLIDGWFGGRLAL